MKKGFEVQFHWIFIMIAGAVILTFFFTVVTKQQVIASDKLALKISEDLDALLTGASVSKGTAQHIEIPKTGMRFGCSETCECNFWVGRKSAPYKDKYLFAPPKLEEADLLLWTLDWKLPFRGGNFIYVTNSRTKYFLVYEPGNQQSLNLLKKITAALSSDLNVENVTTSQFPILENKEYPFVQFVFLSTTDVNPMEGVHESFARQNIRGVRITADGNLLFYSPAGDGWFATGSAFVNDAEMFGALFASDITMYQCNLRNAYGHLYWIAQIYHDRLSGVGSPRCVYSAAQSQLSALINSANAVSGGLGTPGFDVNALASVRTLMTQLEQENKRLLLASCPQIY